MSDDAARRGTGFPLLPLGDAARVLAEAGRYGPDHSEGAFASYLGHATPNSGPFRSKLAAFRDWSLIARQGGRVQMTELGRRLAMAPDPLQETEALREAFWSCGVFARLYEDSAKGVPLTFDALGRTGVFNLGITAKSSSRFVNVFVQSAVTARLAERIDDRAVRLLTPDDVVIVTSDVSAPTGSPIAEDQPDAVIPSVRRVEAPIVLRQVWPHRAGNVVFEIRSADPLPAGAFQAIATVVEAAGSVARALQRETEEA